MARIPTTDVVTNANVNVETCTSGRGSVAFGRTFVDYTPSPLSDRTQVLASGDIVALETKYTDRFEPEYYIVGGTP